MDFRKFYIPTVMAGLAILTSANQALAIGIGQYSGNVIDMAGTVYNATLSIGNTYDCSEGTCFNGNITYTNAGTSDLVVGYLSGNKFTMRRYDGNGLNYVQTFNGLTTATGVSGSWFTDSNPSNNKGSFSLGF